MQHTEDIGCLTQRSQLDRLQELADGIARERVKVLQSSDLLATIVLVVGILLIVYRAPLLALELDAAGVAVLDAQMQQSLRQLATGSVDVTLLAERWMQSDPGLRILWLENWITRRVHEWIGAGTSPQSAEPVGLPAALLKPKIRALFELLDAARDVRRLASTGMNQQLALEALLVGGRSALGK